MCCSYLVFGQVESDTLWSIWKNENRPTVERISALENTSKIYQNTNSDTTLILLNQVIQIAQQTDNKEELRDATELLYQVYKKELSKTQKDYKAELDKIQFNSRRNQFLIVGLTLLLGLATGFYVRKKYRYFLETQINLLKKIEELKEKLATQTISSTGKRKELSLDKTKIETAINNKIGESSWLILNLIFENPSISNKEIAEKVSLSIEGVSSSLRRMYTAFDVKGKGNKKVTLLMKAVNISVQD